MSTHMSVHRSVHMSVHMYTRRYTPAGQEALARLVRRLRDDSDAMARLASAAADGRTLTLPALADMMNDIGEPLKVANSSLA